MRVEDEVKLRRIESAIEDLQVDIFRLMEHLGMYPSCCRECGGKLDDDDVERAGKRPADTTG